MSLTKWNFKIDQMNQRFTPRPTYYLWTVSYDEIEIHNEIENEIMFDLHVPTN